MTGQPAVGPGDLVAAKYRVERLLGEGAMGVVVAATHLELGTHVAIKLMLPAAVSGPDGVERFLREARAASGLRSDHVCKVLDVARTDTGAPYIVMEMLEGGDLESVLAARGPLPVGVLASFMGQICEAIGEAHAMGIVHRDLKPQNLFLARKFGGAEAVKVLDFGISKLADGRDRVRTQTATIMGTPVYMSPEQCQSSTQVDGRTDIWALGVILYQLATGRLPFDGDDFLQIALAITTTQPALPSAHRADLPAAFDMIVMRCLQKDREQRYATALDLARDLEPLLGTTTGSVTADAWNPRSANAIPRRAPMTTLGGAVHGGDEPQASTRGGRRPLAVAVAAAGVGVAAAAAVALLMGTGAGHISTASKGGDSAAGAATTPGTGTGAGAAAVLQATAAATGAQGAAAAHIPTAMEDRGMAAPPAADTDVNTHSVAAAAPQATTKDDRSTSAVRPPALEATPAPARTRSRSRHRIHLHVDSITADTIHADTIKARKIEADEIEAKRIKAEQLKAEKIEVKGEDLFKR